MESVTQNIKHYIVTALNRFNLDKKIENYRRIDDDLYEFFGIDDLEEIKQLKTKEIPSLVDKNIDKLSKVIPLNSDEKKILRFILLLKTNEILDDVFDLFENVSIYKVKTILSKLLDIDKNKINEIFSSNSLLLNSSLIDIDFGRMVNFPHKIDVLNDRFAEKMVYTDETIFDMLKEFILKSDYSNLDLDDYKHIKDIKNLLEYLKTPKQGVNILFYGRPGTGKTELAKLLAKELHKNIYEISEIDFDNEYLSQRERLKAYVMSQTILNKEDIILYDEAEDIFFKENDRQDKKAWINKQLQSNKIPTIWITNNVNAIDDAIIRRFDYVLHIDIPSKKHRKKIIKKYANVSKKTMKLLSSHKSLAPAIIQRAVKVWNGCSSDEKELIRIVNNTLQAQGYPKIYKKKSKKMKTKIDLPNFYNPEFINCDIDLDNLVKGIKSNPNARICMYGIAGTGKSAFGKYIAKTLNKEVILKKGSDLLNMYVGGTEANIAKAFKEAKEKNAVLIFDEVDSFLQDRKQAMRSWEISQVNEMLTQMENFDGIFIATTNLMENLDKASIRRFDIKMEFKPLDSIQIEKMFVSISKELNIKIDTFYLKKARELSNLTLGDFATITRQNKFHKINSSKDLFERLKYEVELKEVDNSPKIGLV